ncbi:MAG TPA: DUF3775 domain-containing protein [Pirellulaceae bacterium]|nr:DUF3775 domain-containing protein [Pirellulaceae bacterium]
MTVYSLGGQVMKRSEIVANVIDLASAIRNYWNSELPKRHSKYPVILPGEDSGPPPRETSELKDLLTSLPDEEIHVLVLLMYLGRGDFTVDQLAEHYESVKQRFPKREWAVSQILGKAPLADYLTDGAAELKKSGIDLDDLALLSVGSSS